MTILKGSWRNRIVIVCAMLLLAMASCHKQTNEYTFTKINIGTNDDLNCIQNNAIGNMAYIAGGKRWENATIYKSTDNGSSWVPVSLDKNIFNKSILSITYTGADNWIFAGDSGIWAYYDSASGNIVRTQNAEWLDLKSIKTKAVTIPTLEKIIVDAVGTNQNGSKVMTLDLSGNILSSQKLSFEVNRIVHAIPYKFICGYGAVMKSSGFSDWQFLNLKNDNFKDLCNVYNNNTNSFYVVGFGGGIYYSKNFGDDWTILKKRNGNDYFTKIKALTTTKIWAVGRKGKIVEINTNDNSYRYVNNSIKEDINDLEIFSTNDGIRVVLVGSAGCVYETIIKS